MALGLRDKKKSHFVNKALVLCQFSVKNIEGIYACSCDLFLLYEIQNRTIIVKVNLLLRNFRCFSCDSNAS